MSRQAYLVMEDGTVYEGQSFGAERDSYGELVFSTSMTGYQEALTDPSFAGQLVVLTYPLVGNYGINDADNESVKVQVAGFVVREHCLTPSNGGERIDAARVSGSAERAGDIRGGHEGGDAPAPESGGDDGGTRPGLAIEGGGDMGDNAPVRRRGPRGARDDAGGVPVGAGTQGRRWIPSFAGKRWGAGPAYCGNGLRSEEQRAAVSVRPGLRGGDGAG